MIRLLTTAIAVSVLLLSVGVSTLWAADAASISGTVSNTATGNLLEGAKIEVPKLGLSALTDTPVGLSSVISRRASTS